MILADVKHFYKLHTAVTVMLFVFVHLGCAVSPVTDWEENKEMYYQVGPEGRLPENNVEDNLDGHLPERPTLAECVEFALKMHAQGKIADSNIEIAKARLAQARSAYWPKLTLSTRVIHMDEDQYTVQEGQPLDLGSNTSALADAIALAQVVNSGIAAQPGNPAFDAAYAAARSQTLQMLQSMSLPDMEVKVLGQNSWTSSLDLIYPIFTGGKISAVNEKARVGLKYAHSRKRQTEHEIITRVKKMYQAVLLAQEMLELGEETLTRFKVILDITERVYKGGSGTVKKTDYLKNKVFVSVIEGQVTALKLNLKMAKSGLLNAMGINSTSEIELAEGELGYEPDEYELENLIESAFMSRPEWRQTSLGIRAAKASIKEAKSEYYPKVAIFGSAGHLENDYDHGIVDWAQNTMSVGVGVDLPIFNGGATAAAVREAKARHNSIVQTKQLLENGIRTQVQTAYLKLEAAKSQIEASRSTLEDARENRELNLRAYEVELVETQAVIESQLMETFAKAGYLKSVYDYNVSEAQLMHVTGNPEKEE